MNINIRAGLASGSLVTEAEFNSYTDLTTTNLGDGVFVHSGLWSGKPVAVIEAPSSMDIAARQS